MNTRFNAARTPRLRRACRSTQRLPRFNYKTLYAALLALSVPFSASVYADDKTGAPVRVSPQAGWFSYATLSQGVEASYAAWQKLPEGTVPYVAGCAVGSGLALAKDRSISFVTTVVQNYPVYAAAGAGVVTAATFGARYLDGGVELTDQIAAQVIALPDTVTQAVSQYLPEAFRTGVSHGYNVGTVVFPLVHIGNALVNARSNRLVVDAAERPVVEARSHLLETIEAGGRLGPIARGLGVALRPTDSHQAHITQLKNVVEGLDREGVRAAAAKLANLGAARSVEVASAMRALEQAMDAVDADEVVQSIFRQNRLASMASRIGNLAFDAWTGAGFSHAALQETPASASGSLSAGVQPMPLSSDNQTTEPTKDNQLVVWRPLLPQCSPCDAPRLDSPAASSAQSAASSTNDGALAEWSVPNQPRTVAPGADDGALVVSNPTVEPVVADDSPGSQLVVWTPVEQASDAVSVSGQLALPSAPAQQPAPAGASAGEAGTHSRALVVANAEEGADSQQERAQAPVLSLEGESKPALPAVSAPAPDPGTDPSPSEGSASADGSVILVMDVPEEDEEQEEGEAQEEDEDGAEADSGPEQPDEGEIPVEQVDPLVVTVPTPPSAQDMSLRLEAGAYNGNARAANTMFQMSLSDRLGSYYPADDSQRGNAWVRYSGSRSHSQDSSGQLRTKGDQNSIMMGVDMLKHSNHAGDQFAAGVMGGYGHYAGDTRSNRLNASASGKVDGHGFGLYGTYQQNAAAEQGVFADSWLMWNRFENRVKGDNAPAQKYDAQGITASVELGYNIKLAERDNVKYLIQPRTQAVYQNVRSKNLSQADGTTVKFENGSRVQTTVGVRAAAQIRTGLTTMVTPHIEANWLHTTKGYGVRMDDVKTDTNSGRNIGQLKLGVQGDLNRNVSVDAGLFHNRGNDRYRETGGNLSVTYRY